MTACPCRQIAIMNDPVIKTVLRDLQSNPTAAQSALKDKNIQAKIQKLVTAGILSFGGPKK